MKSSLHDHKWPWLAALALAGASAPVASQGPNGEIEEPRWLRFRVTEASLGVFAEGNHEENTYRASGTTATYDRIFVGPLVGVKSSGSFYHPNLLRYDLHVDGSYGWGQQETKSGVSVERREMQYLGLFMGNATMFGNKPFATSVFGNYDHTHRDYDFFSRVTVDSWRYGARSGYSEGPVPVSVSYLHRDEDISGLATPSVAKEDSFVLNAMNQRDAGASTFNYTFDQYSRTDLDRVGEGADHTLALSDSENFGSYKQHRLQTSASYTRRESDILPSDQFNAQANLSSEYRHNLNSYFDANYDHYRQSAFSSDSVGLQAQLSHRLYESLTTTLMADGSDYEASDGVFDGYTRRYGGGLGLNYTKRLGRSSRLNIGNSVHVDHIEQNNLSTVRNERHTFNLAGLDSFFLDQINVTEATIVVTDVNDNLPGYVRGVDYEIGHDGPRTLIQRLSGSRIPAGATVLVDYESVPTPAGSYESLTEAFHVRLDLWDNLWSLYGRLTLFRNNAEERLRIQQVASYAVGTEVAWHGLRAGAEYEIYDSTLSSYNSARLFQSVNFKLDSMSSLGLHFSETWTEYVDANRSEENYRFIARYSIVFSSRFSANVEGGVAFRRGAFVEQDLATLRPGIEWRAGKTSVKAGYDFEYELLQSREERVRQMFFVRARRMF
ncbi:MAG: hypothetical protein HZA90_26705 [Verrucomicrobia bacterium]|nr:hypothetical protein [Verrucomicrobiota bacterium]